MRLSCDSPVLESEGAVECGGQTRKAPTSRTDNGFTPRDVAQNQRRTEIANELAAAEQRANPAGG